MDVMGLVADTVACMWILYVWCAVLCFAGQLSRGGSQVLNLVMLQHIKAVSLYSNIDRSHFSTLPRLPAKHSRHCGERERKREGGERERERERERMGKDLTTSTLSFPPLLTHLVGHVRWCQQRQCVWYARWAWLLLQRQRRKR